MTEADGKELKRRKFEWMARVLEDKRLRGDAARILVYCALQFERQLRFSVRQETVAAKLGVRRQTVGAALKRGQECGWLALDAERTRGRAHRNADAYRLTFGIGAQARTYSDPEIGARGGQKYVRETGVIGAGFSAASREDDTLQVYPGNTSRCGARPRPDEYCPKHMPDGTVDDCGLCARARKRAERWDREQEQLAADEMAARKARRMACTLCDEEGWLRADPELRCDHGVAPRPVP